MEPFHVTHEATTFAADNKELKWTTPPPDVFRFTEHFPSMAVVFMSYSHKDEAVRNELEVHLTPLKRQGVVEIWHDRRIVAGDDFSGQIGTNLEAADVVLLLVSPYFLASDYCYDVELTRAMERHAAGAARVIPVIVDPCDWHSAPFGKLLAVPTDGKPISKFPNRHDGLLEVAQAIRNAVGSKSKPSTPIAASSSAIEDTPQIHAEARSSNLRVKKTFTDHEKDSYLDESFEYIAKYFEASLDELHKRNAEITFRFHRVDAKRLSAVIYRSGKSASECSVFLGKTFGKSIAYSSDAEATNSYNESLTVADDGHALHLRAAGFSSLSSNSKIPLSQQGAAELLWEILIRPLQQ